MTIKIKHKRGTASSITTANPTLAAGELAFETDTRRFKVGDGTTAWSSLSYVTPYVTATDRILGRSSAGAGAAEEISCGSFGRSLIGSADAAAARTTLSVQPTASPAFTGTVSAAAANFTGAVSVTSPLTLTGTVAGNVRALKLQTSGVDRWQITPGFDAESGSNAGSTFWITRWSDAGVFLGTPIAISRATGSVTLENPLFVQAGSASAPGVAFSGDANTGLAQIGGADTASLVTAGVERVRVGSGGRVAFHANSEKYGIQINNGSTGNGPFIGSDGADIFTISTSGGAERVRVDAGGNLGIGVTPAASTTSNVQASGDITLYGASRGFLGNLYFQSGWKYAGTGHGWGWIEGSGNVDFSRTSSSGTAGNTATLNTAIRINSNSEVLIGTTTDNGAYLLQVNSQIYATNATIATSDARFKTNVKTLTDATAVIEALRAVAFDFLPHAERNFATERQVGLIAQEAQAALAGTDYADSVVAQCGDHLGLAYEKLVPVLIKALQESNARIAALEERLNHA